MPILLRGNQKNLTKSDSYKEISAKIKELGYKIPDDVIII